jgi:hypothetical protein
MLALNQIVSSAVAIDKEVSDFEKAVYNKKSALARGFWIIAKDIFDTICDALEIERFDTDAVDGHKIDILKQYMSNRNKKATFTHLFVDNRNENYLAKKIDYHIANAEKQFNILVEFPINFFNKSKEEIALDMQDLYAKELAEKHSQESELNTADRTRKAI